MLKTTDCIHASFNKGEMCVEAEGKSFESNIKERKDFIQASFDKGQTLAKVWSYTWTVFVLFAVATGIQTNQQIQNCAFDGPTHSRRSPFIP